MQQQVVCLPVQRFNTQPPEGGWETKQPPLKDVYDVSTHSRPKAAGGIDPENRPKMGFNTQPPEGGWDLPKWCTLDGIGFNTQPPEGGWETGIRIDSGIDLFQHTAARRRLEPLSKALLHQVSQPRFR